MEFIDTHCHIQSAGRSDGERSTSETWAKNPVLTATTLAADAQSAGISQLVTVGCDLADSRLAIAVAQAHSHVWASVGIHPHEAKDYAHDEAARAAFAELATQPAVVAIGECGLDYYYGHSPKADQLVTLRFQLELAAQHDLPLIFHVRDAFDDFWPVFDDYPGVRGVLHSYTDSIVNLERAVQAGLFIGVNGIATFAKQPEQLAMYRAIPAANLVLETDAPFLTPAPYRGKVNEPKQVITVAAFLSNLYSVDLSSLADTTTANAKTLFGLK